MSLFENFEVSKSTSRHKGRMRKVEFKNIEKRIKEMFSLFLICDETLNYKNTHFLE